MVDSEFYITLPSNSAMSEFPTNRPSNFKVNLSHKHELRDGVWEIGLAEIQFTNNWRFKTPAFDLLAWVGNYPASPELCTQRSGSAPNSMPDAEARLLDVREADLDRNRLITAYVQVPACDWLNEYEFGEVLAMRVKAALNNQISKTNENRDAFPFVKTVRYERSGVSHRAEFQVESGKYLLFTTDHVRIMDILGLIPTALASAKLEKAGKRVKVYSFSHDNAAALPIQSGFSPLEVMFVYSSVCEEQHIGDQVGNLLKTVPVTVEQGKRQCERYSPPTYTRLRPSTLQCVDIQLLDKTGEEVAFSNDSSVVVLQLHVRKRRPATGWC